MERTTNGDEPSPRHLPFTPGVKKALEYALRSATRLGSNHVGPEHLLAGLAHHSQGSTPRLLTSLGFTAGKIEAAILNGMPAPSPTAARTFAVFVPVGKSIFKNGGKVYPDHAMAKAAHPTSRSRRSRSSSPTVSSSMSAPHCRRTGSSPGAPTPATLTPSPPLTSSARPSPATRSSSRSCRR